jgi:hypothetical protein
VPAVFEHGRHHLLTDYVLAQRLVRAYASMVEPRYQAEKISTIAMTAASNDVSLFHRMFRGFRADHRRRSPSEKKRSQSDVAMWYI